jgi:hypothetical protein
VYFGGGSLAGGGVGELLLLAAPVELKLVRTTSGWAVRPRAVAVGWRLYVGRYSSSSRCTILYISVYSCTMLYNKALAGEAHYRLVNIHPFLDENGQICMYLIQR